MSSAGPGHSYQFDGDVPTFDDPHPHDEEEEVMMDGDGDQGYEVDAEAERRMSGMSGSGGRGRPGGAETERIPEGPGNSRWDFIRRRVKSEVEETDDVEASQQLKWEELRADVREVTHQGKHFSFVGVVQAEKRRVNFSKSIQRLIRKIAVAEDVAFVEQCKTLTQQYLAYNDITLYPRLSEVYEIFVARLLRPEKKTMEGGAVCEVVEFIMNQRMGQQEFFAHMYLPQMIHVVFSGLMCDISSVQSRFLRILARFVDIGTDYIIPHLPSIVPVLVSLMNHAPSLRSETERVLRTLDDHVCGGRLYIYYMRCLPQVGAREKIWILKYLDNNWEDALKTESDYLEETQSIDVEITDEESEMTRVMERSKEKRVWTPGNPSVFFAALEHSLTHSEEDVEFSTLLIHHLKTKLRPLSVREGSHIPSLCRTLLHLLGHTEKAVVTATVAYLVEFLSVFRTEFLTVLREWITVDRVMKLLPRYAILAEEPTCGSFVVPSTFHGVVDKLCRVPLIDGAKETELVKNLVRNVREHYTAAFYSPVLEIIEVSEPEALRWAMIRTSFLINYASLENVFTLELVAAMLCQEPSIGQWCILFLLFDRLEREKTLPHSEAEMRSLFSLCTSLEATIEQYVAENVNSQLEPVNVSFLCRILASIYMWVDFSESPKWVDAIFQWNSYHHDESTLDRQWNELMRIVDPNYLPVTERSFLEHEHADGQLSGGEQMKHDDASFIPGDHTFFVPPDASDETKTMAKSHVGETSTCPNGSVAHSFLHAQWPQKISVRATILMLIASDAHNIHPEMLCGLADSAWEMLLDPKVEVVQAAAFLLTTIARQSPGTFKSTVFKSFYHSDIRVRVEAISRFSALWFLRKEISRLHLQKLTDGGKEAPSLPLHSANVGARQEAIIPTSETDSLDSRTLMCLANRVEEPFNPTRETDEEKLDSMIEESRIVHEEVQQDPRKPFDATLKFGGFRHMQSDPEDFDTSEEPHAKMSLGVLAIVSHMAKKWKRKTMAKRDAVFNPRTPLPEVMSVITIPLIDLCMDDVTEVFTSAREVLSNCMADDPETLLRHFMTVVIHQREEEMVHWITRLCILHRHVPEIHEHYAYMLINFLVALLGLVSADSALCARMMALLIPIIADVVQSVHGFSVHQLLERRMTFLMRGAGSITSDSSQTPHVGGAGGGSEDGPSAMSALALLNLDEGDEDGEQDRLPSILELSVQNAKALFGISFLAAYPNEASLLERVTQTSFFDAIKRVSRDTPTLPADVLHFERASKRAWVLFLRHLLPELTEDFSKLELYVRSLASLLLEEQNETVLMREIFALMIECATRFGDAFEKNELYELYAPCLCGFLEQHGDDEILSSGVHAVVNTCFAAHGEAVFLVHSIPVLCPSSFGVTNDIWKKAVFKSSTVFQMLSMLNCPISDDELGVLRSLRWQVPAMEAPYTSQQIFTFLAEVARSQPSLPTSAKFVEMFHFLLPNVFENLMTDDVWDSGLMNLLSLFASRPTGKKGNVMVGPEMHISGLPFETQCELVHVARVLVKYHSFEVYRRVSPLIHSVIPVILAVASEEGSSHDCVVDYVWDGFGHNPSDMMSEGLADFLNNLNSVIVSKFSWDGLATIIWKLVSIVQKFPEFSAVVCRTLGTSLIDAAYNVSTQSNVRDSVVRLICSIMENGVEPLTKIDNDLGTMSPGQYKNLIRSLIIPVSLSLGKQGYIYPHAASAHWTWLMESVVAGYSMDPVVLPEVFLVLKAITVRGHRYLSSYWPRTVAFLVKFLKNPQRPFSVFFLEFLEFMIVSQSSLSMYTKEFVKTHLPSYPIQSEVERDIVGRIHFALREDRKHPPSEALLEKKVRSDASKSL